MGNIWAIEKYFQIFSADDSGNGYNNLYKSIKACAAICQH